MEYCSLIGVIDFPGGNCADWFAGTSSAAAVIVALSGYFLTERRLSRDAHSAHLATLASISALLKSLVRECQATAMMFERSMVEFECFDTKFSITTPLASIKTPPFPHLDKDQNLLLLQTSKPELADGIVHLIQAINAVLAGTEDHVTLRAKLSSLLDEAKYSLDELKRESDLGKRLLAQLFIVGHNSEFMLGQSADVHAQSLKIAEEFNCMIAADFDQLQNFEV